MYTSGFNRLLVNGTLLAILSVASGCSSIDRLSQIGEQPKLAAIENPTSQPGYKPVQMPMPTPEVASYNANSLWRNGSRAGVARLSLPISRVTSKRLPRGS